MKRYLAFADDTYYPGGGWDDFIGDFNSKAEAFAAAKKNNEHFGWWQVVDRDTKEFVEETQLENGDVG